MQRSATSAQQVGVTYEELISYIGVISSTTRRSAETIGESLKTIFARMSDIQEGGFDSVDSIGINNVEEALDRVNVKLRDSDYSFRNFSDVLEDLSKKWDTLNEIEQANIAKAVAGTRQRESFYVLMTRMNQALELQQKEANSAGLAMDRYNIYLNSVEASANKFRTTWEGLWQNAISSDSIKFFYDLGIASLDAINKMGGIEPTVLGIVSALVLLNSTAVGTSILGLSKYITILSTAISGLVLNINLLKIAWFEKTFFSTLLGMINPATAAFIGLAAAITIAYQAYKLYELQESGLVESANQWDLLFNNILSKGGQSKQVLESYANSVKAVNEEHEKSGWIADIFVDKQKIIDSGLKETINALGKTSDSYEEYQENVKKAANIAGWLIDENGKLYREMRTGRQTITVYMEDISLLTKEEIKLNQETQILNDTWVKTWRENGNEIVDTKKKVEDLTDAVARFQDFNTGALDLINKGQSGDFGFEDLSDLKSKYENYLELLSIEDGALELNTDKLRAYTIEKQKALIETAKLTAQTQKEKDILDLYAQQLENSTSESRAFTDNFDVMLMGAKSLMSESALAETGFGSLVDTLMQMNDQYEEGTITSASYFDGISSRIDDVNFVDMFESNTEAANTFFSALSTNGIFALSQMNSAFNAGDMELIEYLDGVSSMVDVFEYLGNALATVTEGLGMSEIESSEMMNSVTEGLGMMQEGTDGLIQSQEITTMVAATFQETSAGILQFGTEAYNEAMRQIAETAAASGQSFTDSEGKALVGADNIYKYLTATGTNFGLFANQTANRAGKLVSKVMQGAGRVVEEVGKALNKIDAKISFKWVQDGELVYDFFGRQLTLPNFVLEAKPQVTGFEGISQAIQSLASDLQGTDLDWDSDIFESAGDRIKDLDDQQQGASSSASGAAGAIGEMADAIGSAGSQSKETTKSIKGLMDLVTKMIRQQKKEEKEQLKEQLEGYKKIIDARKKVLDQLLEEKQRKDELADKTKKISDIEAELLEIQFDDSREAQAKKQELMDQLADAQKALDDYQYKQGIQDQKKALDEDYARFKEIIDAKIQAIDDYLEKSGQLALDVLAMIRDEQGDLLQKLIDWNKDYGTGLEEDVIGPWQEAAQIIKDFTGDLSSIATKYTVTVSSEGGTHHTGVYSGPVGGGNWATKSNEMFAKLLKGEVVLRPEQVDNFMNRTLPSMLSPDTESSLSNNIKIDKFMEINVTGNLDKTTLPDIQRIVDKAIEKLNSAMHNRGYLRNANVFG